jgi:hypothetical protein
MCTVIECHDNTHVYDGERALAFDFTAHNVFVK